MSRIRRLVSPPADAARSESWLVPGILAIAVACIALGAACEVDPDDTGHARLEVQEPASAVFINEDGVAHNVSGDLAWVAENGAAGAKDPAHPGHPDVIDLNAHGGIETIDHGPGYARLVLADGTVLEIRHPDGAPHSPHGGHGHARPRPGGDGTAAHGSE